MFYVMETENSDGSLNAKVGSTNFVSCDSFVKTELTYEDVRVTDHCYESTSQSCELENEGVLECEQIDLMTESEGSLQLENNIVKPENDSEIQYNNQNLVGAFYEVNFNAEEVDYSSGTVDPAFSFSNGESQNSIVLTGTSSSGEECIIQLVDPIPEHLKGSHTIRCADGSEIHFDIVHTTEEHNDETLNESRNVEIVLPTNSSSVKTYPPSNKSYPHNSHPVLAEDDTSFSYFPDISDRTEEELKVDSKPKIGVAKLSKKTVEAKSSGIFCLKCKRKFSKPHQLDWHNVTICGTKPYRCYNCNKRFSKDRLNYHVSICHDRTKKSNVNVIVPHATLSSDSD